MSKKKHRNNPNGFTLSNFAADLTMCGAEGHVVSMAIQQIPIDRLFVEEDFQRVLRMDKVHDILRKFSEKKVNPVKVHMEHDGVFSVLDGQHTTQTLRIMGYTHAPCIVYEGLTKQQKAHLFRTQDENKSRMTPYDRFKAATVEADPQCLALKAMLERADFPQGKINALASLRELTAMFDEDTMVCMLHVIALCWPQDALKLRSEIYSGTAELLRFCALRGVEFPFGKYVVRICRFTPKEIFKEFAQEYPNVRQAHSSTSVDVREAMRKVLTRIYNNQLRNDRLPIE